MKNCYKCGINKNISEFSINKNKADKLNSECKECQKKYFKEYYKNNKEKHIKAVTENKSYKKKEIARYKIEQGGCIRCGYNKHPVALQFHHLDKNTKDFNIGANLHLPWELLLKEIEKCEILCANCHAIEHSNYNWTNKKLIRITKKRKNILLSDRYIKKNKTETTKNRIKKSNLPDDETLQKLLFEYPSEQLAKQFNCSGSYLSKYCKKRNIKKPPRGYWS